MVTSLDEESLEALIVADMTAVGPTGGWIEGDPHAFDRAHAVDLAQLTAFIGATQPDLAEPLGLEDDSPVRRKFLARLQGEITKHGVVAVLLQHGPHSVDLFFPTPTVGNADRPVSRSQVENAAVGPARGTRGR